MPIRTRLFFRDAARLYLFYLTAGAAAVPAAICYAFLAANGWQRWWSVVPLLALGLAAALFAWKLLDKKFNLPVSPMAVSKTFNAPIYAFGFDMVGSPAAGSTSFWVQTDQASSIGQLAAGERRNLLVSAHS